jgi:nitrite reductase (NADH) small subunit
MNTATQTFIPVCRLADILPGCGVAALVQGRQIAIFRHADGNVYAVGNHDPFSKANVIARGITGSKNGVPKVASPIYKQNFDLRNGLCLEDPTVGLGSYAVQIVDGSIAVAV